MKSKSLDKTQERTAPKKSKIHIIGKGKDAIEYLLEYFSENNELNVMELLSDIGYELNQTVIDNEYSIIMFSAVFIIKRIHKKKRSLY